MLPLTAPGTGAYGLTLMMIAHLVGWPVVEGGSAGLIDALVADLAAHGGQVETGHWVSSLAELPPARVVLLDVTPRQLAALAGSSIGGRAGRALRGFRYGPGVCKVDWALSGPVPWQAAACQEAGTVHLGGTLAEIARSEAQAVAGKHAEQPYCLVAQPGVVDASRAPAGQHTLWGYCHVPSGSTVDMADRIEAQIERFAPGVPGADPGPVGPDRGRDGAVQPELHWRRHQQRRGDAVADTVPPDRAVESLPDPAAAGVPVLGIHPARRRCARHVR
jgi:phytoene dehydrogenase-like protein